MNKKNMKKSKDIPVEIYLPKTNPKQTLVDNEEVKVIFFFTKMNK